VDEPWLEWRLAADLVGRTYMSPEATGGELTGVATKRRFFAMVIDNALAMLLSVLPASRLPEELGHVRRAIVVGTYLAYYLIQEGLWSTTLGKRLLGLRVAHLNGADCGWAGAAIRTVTRVLEVNPLVLGVLPGGLVVAFSKRHQRLGDMLARCVVVDRIGPAVQQ